MESNSPEAITNNVLGTKKSLGGIAIRRWTLCDDFDGQGG